MRHTSDTIAIDLVVLAILRVDDKIVLIQQNMGSGATGWTVPGGLVEAGELLPEALIREVREESGVEVEAVSRLAFISQLDRPTHQSQSLFYAFEVSGWHGELCCLDPDEEILAVALVPLEAAIERLRNNGGWLSVQAPLIAYLSGEVGAGATWFYREKSGIQQRHPS